MAKASRWAILKNPFFWCVATRVLVALLPRIVQGDAADYELMARNLLNGHGFSRCWVEPYPPTTQRPPLLPLLLAGGYWLGIPHGAVPFIINLLSDLASMVLARKWAATLGLKSERFAPWLIAACPLLIAYSNAATTENISITIFLAAALTFARGQWLASGSLWGLLALSRSFYLLFPGALALLLLTGWLKAFVAPQARTVRNAFIAAGLLIAGAAILPSTWMVRNWVSLNRFAFSQGGTSAYQMYSGLCINGFDWWRRTDVEKYFTVPEVLEVVRSHCKTDDEMSAINDRMMERVRECIRERPFEVARNIVTKQVLLLTKWGQLFPYYRVPYVVIGFVDALLFLFWFTVIRLLWVKRAILSRKSLPRDAILFSVTSALYVFGITLPFGVDARYMLAPVLMLALSIYPLSLRGPKPKGSGPGRSVQ